MKAIRNLIISCLVGIALCVSTACVHHSEGPLERTGEHLDRAVEHTGQAVGEAGEAVLAPIK